MARKWVAVEFGGPEVLRNIEVAVPDPGHGQVTVDVRAVGMNPADGYLRIVDALHGTKPDR